MSTVVFDRKSGKLGIKRKTLEEEKKTFSSNYVVDIVDPMNWRTLKTVPGFGEKRYDWHQLPNTDPRVQYWKLYEIIEGGIASWYYSGWTEDDSIVVEEAVIENPHEVFELVRKIFG